MAGGHLQIDIQVESEVVLLGTSIGSATNGDLGGAVKSLLVGKTNNSVGSESHLSDGTIVQNSGDTESSTSGSQGVVVGKLSTDSVAVELTVVLELSEENVADLAHGHSGAETETVVLDGTSQLVSNNGEVLVHSVGDLDTEGPVVSESNGSQLEVDTSGLRHEGNLGGEGGLVLPSVVDSGIELLVLSSGEGTIQLQALGELVVAGSINGVVSVAVEGGLDIQTVVSHAPGRLEGSRSLVSRGSLASESEFHATVVSVDLDLLVGGTVLEEDVSSVFAEVLEEEGCHGWVRRGGETENSQPRSRKARR